jgi:Protein of unknown function (DUF3313)
VSPAHSAKRQYGDLEGSDLHACQEERHVFRSIFFVTIGLLASATACSTLDDRGEPIPTSGLLEGNYALLSAGGDDEAVLRYSNPEAEWANYHQVMLEPVTFWEAEWSGFGDLSLYERKQLAIALYSKTHDELAKDYQMVRDAGDGVLHIEVELTGAAGSGASVETQIFDGATGELLAAAVDRRVLTESLADSSEEVLAVFASWASRLRYRLCSARGRGDCEPFND